MKPALLALVFVAMIGPALSAQDPRIQPLIEPSKAVLGEPILYALDING